MYMAVFGSLPSISNYIAPSPIVFRNVNKFLLFNEIQKTIAKIYNVINQFYYPQLEG
jgi:hypothetical protein